MHLNLLKLVLNFFTSSWSITQVNVMKPKLTKCKWEHIFARYFSSSIKIHHLLYTLYLWGNQTVITMQMSSEREKQNKKKISDFVNHEPQLLIAVVCVHIFYCPLLLVWGISLGARNMFTYPSQSICLSPFYFFSTVA